MVCAAACGSGHHDDVAGSEEDWGGRVVAGEPSDQEDGCTSETTQGVMISYDA